MSGKLDQSLDEILSTRKSNARGRGGRRGPNTGRKVTTAPVGGIKKTSTTTRGKPGAKPAVAPTQATGVDTKIMVSQMPPDANESMIKDYFGSTIGPVKSVTITYGPNGVSRGIATIIFHKPGAANEAAAKLNGLRVDRRPIRVEVVVDAKRAPPPAPVLSLSDRITQPKGQNKKTHTTKQSEKKGRPVRGRNAGRPKKKTAEELDAEMTDYFGTGNNTADDATVTNGTATNGTAPTANGGDDLGMDEIS